MGKITVKTKECSSQITYETETIYESFEDFLYFEAYKRDAMNEAVKSFVDGQLFGGAYPEDNSFGEEFVEKESAVVDIDVGKKETKH